MSYIPNWSELYRWLDSSLVCGGYEESIGGEEPHNDSGIRRSGPVAG